MSWELYIHQLDVSQGESSLIVARNTATGAVRSLLVDGGRSYQAEIVHTYVAGHIFGQPGVDSILATHYDIDHSGGLQKLLIADNAYAIGRTIAEAAGAAAFATAGAAMDNTPFNQCAAAAGAAAAAAYGGYNDANGGNHANVASQIGAACRSSVAPPFTTPIAAAQDGYDDGLGLAKHAPQRNTMLILGPGKRRDVCVAAAVAAGSVAGGTAAARSAAAHAALRPVLETAITFDSRFDTGGLYAASTVIDVGAGTVAPPAGYVRTVEGGVVLSSNHRAYAPNSNRTRITPALGAEILWNVGPLAAAAPANAPAVFVVAANRYVRGAPARDVPIGGDRSNNVSIGLIIRFNNFFFYTGGDLPSEGEDLILDDILSTGRGNGLTDPQNPAARFPAPNHICAFKCGHHGSATSTSDTFVDRIRAASAFISTGGNMFEHPDQSIVDALHDDADIVDFYFTNLHFATTHVPASNGQNQWTVPGNKGFVAGDNSLFNFVAGRHRGDMTIAVTEQESLSVVHPPAVPALGGVRHQFRVEYWEDDWPAGAQNVVTTIAH